MGESISSVTLLASCLGAGAPAVCILETEEIPLPRMQEKQTRSDGHICASGYVHKQELSRRADILPRLWASALSDHGHRSGSFYGYPQRGPVHRPFHIRCGYTIVGSAAIP